LGRSDLPAILSGVVKTYSFDFSDELGVGETISTKTVTATVYSGTDASPSSLISGAASSSGAVVSQNITTVSVGVVGVLYELLCQITTSAGQTLRKIGLLAIIPDEP
jgi:hypothetical protein